MVINDWYDELLEGLAEGLLIGVVPVVHEGEPSTYTVYGDLTDGLVLFATAEDEATRAQLAVALAAKARQMASRTGLTVAT